MSSLNEPLRDVVRQLADTFNNPQGRESAYFNFYDDSLIIHNEVCNTYLGLVSTSLPRMQRSN